MKIDRNSDNMLGIDFDAVFKAHFGTANEDELRKAREAGEIVREVSAKNQAFAASYRKNR